MEGSQITLFTAIMLGFVFWIAIVEIGYSFAVWTPTVVGLLTGIVIGEVKQCLVISAALMPLYLAFTSAGGTVVHDPAAATIIACVVSTRTGMTPNQAVTLAVPVGLIVANLHTIRRIWFAYPAQQADKYALTGNTKGIVFMGTVFCWVSKIFILWIPMTLMLYFGTDSVAALVEAMPTWLMNALSATGGMLPALGFAMTVNVIGRFNFLPYFFAGFFFVQYGNSLLTHSITAAVVAEDGTIVNEVIGSGSEIPGMALALIGLFLAFLHLTIEASTKKKEEVPTKEEGKSAYHAEASAGSGLITKKDVTTLYQRWWWFSECSNSFSRLQSIAVCIAFMPSMRKLYGHDQEEFNQALQRHLTFFNTEGIWGSVIFGIVLAMEEQRAAGGNIPVEAITGVKAGLMGPFAGIGDTIDWSTLLPLTIVLFLPFVAEGHAWAPIAICVVVTGVTYLEGYYFTHLGYRLGTQAAVTILESGLIQTIITGAGVLGLFMMGGLGAMMVHVYTPVTIPTAANSFSLQTDILDPILPGVLALIPIMAVYRYLTKGGTMMKATLILLAIGLSCGIIGITGDGGLVFGPDGLIH